MKKKKRTNLSSAEHHNKPVNVVCIIYGKSTATYHVPKEIKIKCISEDGYVCKLCSKKEDHIIEVVPRDENILRFIDIHSDRMYKVIENAFQLKCKFSYEILTYQNVIRIFVMPPSDQDRKKITGLATTSYFIGNQLDENCKYKMTGYTTVSPVDQTVTHVFTEAIKEKSDSDTFILDADMHKQLSAFSRDFDKAEDIMGYLEDLYDSYANNITKIVGRVDLHMAVDLAIRSPLSFRLGHEYVPRGWSDIMILGDSSCGKNYVTNRLMEYYKIGEMVGAENCLSGNTKILTKEYGFIKIGKISGEFIHVLNSKKEWVRVKVKYYGKQKTIGLKFGLGSSKSSIKIRATLDHNWKLINKSIIKTKDLKTSATFRFYEEDRADKISFVNVDRKKKYISKDYYKGIIHGLIYGDGCNTGQPKEKRKIFSIRLCGSDKKDLLHFFEYFGFRVSYYPKHCGDPVVFVSDTFVEDIFSVEKDFKKLPKNINNEDYIVGFFRGWVAADGDNNVLSGIKKSLSWCVTVLSKYGYLFQQLDSYFFSKKYYYWNGKKIYRKQHSRYVPKQRGRLKFLLQSFTEDDFLIPRKKEKFKKYVSGYSDKDRIHYFRGFIKNSEKIEDVYCVNVPDTHDFVLERGLLTCNCTFAGLIGGLQQLGSKNWTITWGKIPLNDGGLLCIDEASELRHTDWTRLSRVRSEGIAEVTKINTQSTSARTRLIFLANPIEKTIANYSHGIQAVQDLVKQPEDVRRFDYVLIVAHSDVTVEEIHDKIRSNKMSESMYTPEAEQNLILWAWSRKLDDIKFSEEALEYIYEKSPQFAKKYTFSIPLVQGENVRIKLAKLAIEFAARMYSNLHDGRILHVKKIHVDCALIFLAMIYDKSSSGYSALSKLNVKVEAPYKSERFLKTSAALDAYMDKKQTLEYLLKYDTITFKSLNEYTGRDPIISQEVLSHLLQFDHLIPVSEKATQRYHKTPSFTEYIKIALKALNRDGQTSLLQHFSKLADTEEDEAEERRIKKKKEKKKKNKQLKNKQHKEEKEDE